VYNLRVSDYHTYFVGCLDWGFSVWAHNDYGTFRKALGERDSARLRELYEAGLKEVQAGKSNDQLGLWLKGELGHLSRGTSRDLRDILRQDAANGSRKAPRGTEHNRSGGLAEEASGLSVVRRRGMVGVHGIRSDDQH
jgi:hypothetical protein